MLHGISIHTHNHFTAILDLVRDYSGEPAPAFLDFMNTNEGIIYSLFVKVMYDICQCTF